MLNPAVAQPGAATAAATAAHRAAAAQALSRWLQLLWGPTPVLRLGGGPVPYIEDGALHLPHPPNWRALRAAAAHAAAHLVYSPPGFDGAGLGPLARQLLALLEDARVEALAVRELPGLARLWRPLHKASPDDALSADNLLRRLARALADPAYADPHPWVAKGRRLFWLHEGMALLALRTSAELRGAALRLGHELGQMRLPLNARGGPLLPAYRDDHRWMWAADALPLLASSARPVGVRSAPPPDSPPPDEADAAPADLATTWHPEWDRLIRRLRPQWAGVVEAPAGPASWPAGLPAPGGAARGGPQRRLRGSLQGLARGRGGGRRSLDGPLLDLDALVDQAAARRAGRTPDGRVYRPWIAAAPARAAVCVLVDQSASSADAWGAGGQGAVWQAAAAAATDTACALHALGLACLVACFSSNGRRALHWHTVKAWGEPADGRLAARLARLQPQGSTRLGAALRHAAAQFGPRRAGPCWVLLLSDGQAHDVDVHDPHYLVEDARQAVRAARRLGVRMACLRLGGPAAPAADEARTRRIFGPRGSRSCHSLQRLPGLLQALLR